MWPKVRILCTAEIIMVKEAGKLLPIAALSRGKQPKRRKRRATIIRGEPATMVLKCNSRPVVSGHARDGA